MRTGTCVWRLLTAWIVLFCSASSGSAQPAGTWARWIPGMPAAANFWDLDPSGNAIYRGQVNLPQAGYSQSVNIRAVGNYKYFNTARDLQINVKCTHVIEDPLSPHPRSLDLEIEFTGRIDTRYVHGTYKVCCGTDQYYEVLDTGRWDAEYVNNFARVYEVATTPIRPECAPQYSDVCLSSRWYYDEPNENKNTLCAIRRFHANRMEWCYTTDPNVVSWCQAAGITHFSCSIAASYSGLDRPYRRDGDPCTIQDADGHSIAALGIYWGCANNPGHRLNVMNWIRGCVKAMTAIQDTVYHIQFDEYTLNKYVFGEYKDGYCRQPCYCCYCGSPDKTPQNSALVRSFYDYLQREISRDRTMPPILFSCNNYRIKWEDHVLDGAFSMGCCELPADKEADKEFNVPIVYGRFRTAVAREKAQIVTLVSCDPAKHRKILSLCYATGQHSLMPWDICMSDDARFFGHYGDYAHITGLVRAYPGYLDGYEDAFAFGPGIFDDRYRVSSAFGPGILDDWYGVPFAPAQTVGGNGKVYLFCRAKPGDSRGPKIIHVIEWDDSVDSYVIRIHVGRLFENSNLRPRVRLFRPKAYDKSEHDAAQRTGSFASLANIDDVTVEYEAPWALVRMAGTYLDPVCPWGYLVMESGQ